MILNRCKICGKLVWRVTDGACNACHTKHEQSKKLASTATHVSTPPHYCYNDDWQHNHRPPCFTMTRQVIVIVTREHITITAVALEVAAMTAVRIAVVPAGAIGNGTRIFRINHQ